MSTSTAYILWKTLLPWTPSARTPLVRHPPGKHHWLSGPALVCWSPMLSIGTPDSQTCAGRTRPPAGPATETGAPHSETHSGGKTQSSETTKGDVDCSNCMLSHYIFKRCHSHLLPSDHHYVTLEESFESNEVIESNGRFNTGLSGEHRRMRWTRRPNSMPFN